MAQVRGEGLYHASVMLWEQDEGDGVDIDEIDAGRELEVEECKAFAVTLEEVEGEDCKSFKYKKVANKTKLVATTLPEEFRICKVFDFMSSYYLTIFLFSSVLCTINMLLFKYL